MNKKPEPNNLDNLKQKLRQTVSPLAIPELLHQRAYKQLRKQKNSVDGIFAAQMSQNTRELLPESSVFGESKYRSLNVTLKERDIEKNEVANLGAWKDKHVTLMRSEFAIQGNRMLNDVVNNTKNYRYEKQIDDIERYNIAFRARKPYSSLDKPSQLELKNKTAASDRKFVIEDSDEICYETGNEYLEDPGLKSSREAVLNEALMQKTARIILGSLKLPQKNLSPAQILQMNESDLDNICTLNMLESFVSNFQHLSGNFSIHQLNTKASQVMTLFRRTVESIRDKEAMGPARQNSFEDIVRCEEAHTELLKITKVFQERCSVIRTNIYKTLKRKTEIDNEIKAAEQVRMHSHAPPPAPSKSLEKGKSLLMMGKKGSGKRVSIVIPELYKMPTLAQNSHLVQSLTQRWASIRNVSQAVNQFMKDGKEIDLSTVLPPEYRQRSKIIETLEMLKQSLKQGRLLLTKRMTS